MKILWRIFVVITTPVWSILFLLFWPFAWLLATTAAVGVDYIMGWNRKLENKVDNFFFSFP